MIILTKEYNIFLLIQTQKRVNKKIYKNVAKFKQKIEGNNENVDNYVDGDFIFLFIKIL